MPLILLVRHGENEFVKTGKLAGRLPGVHLNQRGQQQAQELADSLSGLPIKAIYSSPLERATETATPLAERLNLQVQIRDGLVETNVGEWTGQELKHLRKQPAWKAVQHNPSRFRFPGGESFIESQARQVSEIEAIASSHTDNEIVACFSHADPIRLATAYYLGMPLDHFQRLACETASLTALVVSGRGVMLLKFNQRPPFSFPIPPEKHKSKK